MTRRIGEASPPAGNISLWDARRELIDKAHSGEHAKAISDYADAMAAETRDPSRINAINGRIDEIEDEATRSIRAVVSSGGIAAYFDDRDGVEHSIPRGWLDADWLSERLLTGGAVPIDERNNRDRNGSERLVYFRSGEWKALLSKLVGASPSVAVVPTDAGRADPHNHICGASQLEKQTNRDSSEGLPIPTNCMNTSKQEAVRLALWDKYKNGLVPKHLSWKAITDCIRDHYMKRMSEVRQDDPGGPSESTVRRVLDP